MSQNISVISPSYAGTQVLSSLGSGNSNTSGASFAEQLALAEATPQTTATSTASASGGNSVLGAMGMDGSLFASMIASGGAGGSEGIFSILSFILMFILMDQDNKSELMPDAYTSDFSVAEYSELAAQATAATEQVEITTSQESAASAGVQQSRNYDPIVNSALSRLGDPYSQARAGEGDYTDCSYLTRWCYRAAGIELPRTAAAQAKWCVDNSKTISQSELQPGDLIFFSLHENGRYMDITHVGIYAGNNMMVDASSAYGEVVYRPLFGGQVLYGRPR